ncbi:urotensin-2 [Rhinophrynus dorsalis]
MHMLMFSCLILASLYCPFLSLPIIDSREFPYQFPDSKVNLGDLSRLDETYLLQKLPAFVGKQIFGEDSEDLFIKEGLSTDKINMEESIKEALFGKPPRISLLSLLQSKDRKQYKKRGGNLSECFWKYCV